MASHRNINPSYLEAMAKLASSVEKSIKREQTSPKNTVSRTRYEIEKRSYDLSNYAKISYVDEGDSTTLEAANTYTDEAVTNVAVGDIDLSGYATTEYVDTQDASTLELAEAYADGADEVTLAEAMSYTDSSVAGIEAGSASILLGSIALDADIEAGEGQAEALSLDFEAPGGTVLAALIGTSKLAATDETVLPIIGHALAELDIDDEAIVETAITASMITMSKLEPLLVASVSLSEGAHTMALLLQSSEDEYCTFTLGEGTELAIYAIE